MTTSLASLSWMETVPCLEHCQETREKFYTSSQLIYPRSTVCLMTLSDLVGGKHCWVMNDTTIAMSGKKCTSFFSNDWTNNVWLNNYMSNRHLVYPTRVKVLVKHKSFEHFWVFLLLRLPYFTISSKFYTSVLENNDINCVYKCYLGYPFSFSPCLMDIAFLVSFMFTFGICQFERH